MHSNAKSKLCGPISLASRERYPVCVASYNESGSVTKESRRIVLSQDGTVWFAEQITMLIPGEYSIVFEAELIDGVFCKTKCRLWVDADNTLKLEDLENGLPDQAGVGDRSAIKADYADLVQLKMFSISFDPNGPKEMYANFDLSNPNGATILADWKLFIVNPFGITLRISPRLIHTKTSWDNVGPGHPPLSEDLSQTPLEAGGARKDCRATFTHSEPTQPIFGRAGTIFRLSASDVRGREITAEYRVP